jgi:uncharacterized protein YndB with AHSA1/START domain
MKNIKIRHVINLPRNQIWEAITDSECMEKWLMPNNFVPEPGREFEFRCRPLPGFDGIIRCQVLEIVPLESMTISWQSGKLVSIVSFNLYEHKSGTMLNFEHKGFRLKNFIARLFLGSGWKKIIRFHLPNSIINT